MHRPLIIFVLITLLLLNFGCDKNEESLDPDVVATFKGGQITRKEVVDLFNELSQGLDHEGIKQVRRVEVYKDVVRSLALENLIKKRINEKKLDKRKNVKHVMKHISEEINIDELHSQAHSDRIKVSETEIRKYYEDNRDQFGETPLVEAKEEIRGILKATKEKDYFRNYLAELKKNAVITREYRLLKVPQPNEEDLRISYEDQTRASGTSNTPSPEEKEDFKETLQNETEKKWFEQNQNRTLFTVHGKRYSVGEFYQELQELPPEERGKYQGFEGLQDLMDRMIERLLVLEDAYDQMLDTKTKDDVEHVREDVLKQVLHQEEIDDKLEVSDEEMKTFYGEHKAQFVEPPQAKISYIQIGRGQTKDEYERGEKKAGEAYKKLNPGFWKKGQPFENVAREYSEDPETGPKGGEIDVWISESNDFFKEISSHTFHENVLNLPVGEISPPFYFQGSWYIVKVRERKEPRALSFEESKEHIKEELSAKKHEELTLKMRQTLLENADLVIYDDVIESMLAEKD